MNLLNGLSQINTLAWMNLRNIPQRLGTSSVAIFGVACVVGVLIGVLSMATGFQRTMTMAGSPDTAIVMRSGATSEMTSGLGHEETQLIADKPGVLKVDGKPLSSAELLVIVDLPKRATDTTANVPLRGVQSSAFDIRKGIEIVEGRRFEPGRNELIVGRGAENQFTVDVGSTIEFGQSRWDVVGKFTAGGGLSESELWTDAAVLQSVYRRGNSFQSVRVRLESPEAMDTFKEALAADPRTDVDAQLETEYLAQQSNALSTFIKSVGYPLAILMAVGAIFGAINTMYASVSSRTQEIGTLRALGFGSFPVAVSTVVESLVLALTGGILGAAVVYALFNGYTVSTMNGASFSQVVFDFAVTGELLVQGIVAAVVIGFIGGLFPAMRAARMPVTSALRET